MADSLFVVDSGGGGVLTLKPGLEGDIRNGNHLSPCVGSSYCCITLRSFSALRTALFCGDSQNQGGETIDICQLCDFGKTAFQHMAFWFIL